MAHSKTIMRLLWHPTDPKILLTGSKDHLIKVWDVTNLNAALRTVTNIDPVDRMKWVPSSTTATRFGVGSSTSDSSLFVWDINEPYVPQYSFKSEGRTKITDFCFMNEIGIYSTSAGSVVVQDFDKAQKLMEERRARPLCSDILENYAFTSMDDQNLVKCGSIHVKSLSGNSLELTSKSANRKLHFINVLQVNSLYEQTNNKMFRSIDKEIEYFIENYEAKQEDPLSSVKKNSEVCQKAGKTEISEVWTSIYDMLWDSNHPETNNSHLLIEPNKKEKDHNEKFESLQKITLFYRDNPDRLAFDVKNQKIKVTSIETGSGKDQDIQISEEYEKSLLQDILLHTEKHLEDTLSAEQRSQTILDIVIELIDNGEFIHGYQVYMCLSSLIIGCNPDLVKLWKQTYTELLSSMGFYNYAAKFIKSSNVELFDSNLKKIERFIPRCLECKGELEKKKGGKCQKCKNTINCGICLMPCKGLHLWCQICGHGGHFREMKKWFQNRDSTCPSGCGHTCFRF